MANEDLIGNILPNVYLEDIKISNKDILSYKVLVTYSILEPSSTTSFNWSTLPKSITNNIKLSIGYLKNDTTEYKERKILKPFGNLRNPYDDVLINNFVGENKPSIVDTFSTSNTVSISLAKNQELQFPDTLIKKYTTTKEFNVLKQDLNSLEVFAFTYFDPPSSLGIEPVYGNLTFLKLYQNAVIKPEILVYNNKQTGNRFSGQTLVKQSNNYLTTSVVNYDDVKTELAEAYLPLDSTTDQAVPSYVLDLTQNLVLSDIVINSTIPDPKNKPVVQNKNYFSDAFFTFLPLDESYYSKTNKKVLILNGTIFFDIQRWIKDNVAYPFYYNNNLISNLSGYNFKISLIRPVSRGNPVALKEELNITDKTLVKIGDKNILKISFQEKTNLPNVLSRLTGVFDITVEVQTNDPTVSIIKNNRTNLISVMNSFFTYRTSFLNAKNDKNLSESQKQTQIKKSFDNIKFTLDDFLKFYTDIGVNIDAILPGYSSSQGSATIKNALTEYYNIVSNPIKVNESVLNHFIDMLNALTFIYKQVIGFSATIPESLNVLKTYKEILNLSDYLSKSILLFDGEEQASSLILHTTDKLAVFPRPININTSSEEIFRQIIDFANQKRKSAEFIDFINSYALIFSSYLDKSAETNSELPQEKTLTYALTGLKFRNLAQLYSNYLLNTITTKIYLASFKLTNDPEPILDMNSAVWQEAIPENKNLILLSKLIKVREMPVPTILDELKDLLMNEFQFQYTPLTLNTDMSKRYR
jgi:hypothetical protein